MGLLMKYDSVLETLLNPLWPSSSSVNWVNQANKFFTPEESTDGEVAYTLEVPGLNKDTLKVELNGRVLTVSSKVKTKNTESTYLSSITLRKDLNLDSAVCQCKDGILTVKFLKNPQAKESTRVFQVE